MTEQDWLGCADPGTMLEFLSVKASARKLRLFARACLWPHVCRLSRETCQNLLDSAEAFAQGYDGYHGAHLATALLGACAEGSGQEERRFCGLLRDIFGNPFRPVSFDPTWRTAEACALAKGATRDRLMLEGYLDPARLAVLADALEEAGCADPAVLGHLRQLPRATEPHVPGCWVVDAVLGRV